MLTLSQYDKIATKILSTYRKRRGFLYESDELMHAIVYAMALADYTYTEELSNGRTRESYRRQRALFAIRRYLSRRKRKIDPVSIHCGDSVRIRDFVDDKMAVNFSPYVDDDFSMKSSRRVQLQYLFGNADLSPFQLDVIRMYLECYTISEIVSTLGRERKTVQACLKGAVRKMRRISRRKAVA